MKNKTRKIVSISALAAGVFLWDFGLYIFFDEFVANLFLVIILLSGVWSYYELRRAIEIPAEEESTNNNQLQTTSKSNKTEQDD